MMSGIIWLASYPKSGNTWFRIFLSNLRSGMEKPVGINELDRTPIASARGIFDEAAGLDSADLTMDEIDRLRPEVYEHLASNADDTLFMKVHDAYTYIDGNMPLFPKKATTGAIYFIRNPLDVAVSFTHHAGTDYDTTISRMADSRFAFCSKKVKLHNQLRQKLLSWSGHVISWVDEKEFTVCVIRYEDMLHKPLEIFEMAVQYSGLKYEKEQITRALAFSSFEELQRQEREGGFREKSPNSDSFFRKGRIGSWREELTQEQVDRIISDHRAVMQRFGYISDDGKILC